MVFMWHVLEKSIEILALLGRLQHPFVEKKIIMKGTFEMHNEKISV